jgi:hypothetical protein
MTNQTQSLQLSNYTAWFVAFLLAVLGSALVGAGAMATGILTIVVAAVLGVIVAAMGCILAGWLISEMPEPNAAHV